MQRRALAGVSTWPSAMTGICTAGENGLEAGEIVVRDIVSRGLGGIAHERGGNAVKAEPLRADRLLQRGDIRHQQLAGRGGAGLLEKSPSVSP